MDMFDQEQSQYIIIRINGGKHKANDEIQIEYNEKLQLDKVISTCLRKFSKADSDSSKVRMYNKNGVLLFKEDFNLIQPGDVLYIAFKGEDFNYCAILDDYEIGRVLGQGGFGKVMLGKHKEKGTQVAIKFQDVGDQLSSANLIQSIYKEGEALKALQHKHIVKIFHSFIEGKQNIMIMESAMGGELYQYLKQHDKFNEKIARHIILQVIQAMLYCHSRGVIHRDLKLENVLFKQQPEPEDEDDLGEFQIKIIDFGIAGVATDKVDAGTLCYMAPECLEKTAADTTSAIDVWAIGIMAYSMIYGFLPFYNSNEKELIKSIRTDKVKFPSGVPITPLGKDMIKAMLEKDPKKRLDLLQFVTTDYNTLEDDEFKEMYKKAQEDNIVAQKELEEQKEQKLQEKFMENLNINKEESKNPRHRDNSKGRDKPSHPKPKKSAQKKSTKDEKH